MELGDLTNTLHGLFSLWLPKALRHMIRALDRLMASTMTLEEEPIFPYPDRLPSLVIPPLPGETGVSTYTWPAALRRFANAPDEVIASPEWTTWARLLVLGMMAMTFGARDLMFSDDIQCIKIRHARSPPLTIRRAFVQQLIVQHNEHARAGYPDAAAFVQTCANIFQYGTPDIVVTAYDKVT